MYVDVITKLCYQELPKNVEVDLNPGTVIGSGMEFHSFSATWPQDELFHKSNKYECI